MAKGITPSHERKEETVTLAETLDLMTNKDLTEVFNEVCDEGQEVKKFKSKQAGIDKLTADYDEADLMKHIAGRAISSPNDRGGESTEEEEAPKRNRSSLKDDAVLRALSGDTKSRCGLDILTAIDRLGPKATVEKVIEMVCDIHVAPRSKIADEEKPAFVRGYVTHMIRVGFIEVV